MLVEMLPSEVHAGLPPRAVTGEVTVVADVERAPHVLRIALGRIDVSIVIALPARCGLPGVTDLLTMTRDVGPGGELVNVHIASTLLYGHLHRVKASAGKAVVADPRVLRDPDIERLARALAAADEVATDIDALYVDAICLALLARLLGMYCDVQLPRTNRCPSALPKWRLKRVADYVDAHLADHIALADLAAVAGLTRMHFAAQFRAATGIRPHEYILRRRIERAQELLRHTKQTLVDVALSVGFQTQAHFTTVFRRFTDETPHRWRRAVPERSPGEQSCH